MKIGQRRNYGVARQLPPTIMSLSDPGYKMVSDEQWHDESQKLLKTLQFSENDAQYLAEVTKLQSKSLLWFEHRKGRVTASHFGAASKLQ